ncbi:MAG: M23 family metallopeptidase [Actinobacteria bacterium]|nr:M23 family metallopeptidase [Actinomycetota bacterium]
MRTPSSSSAALVDALRVLTAFGMSAQEAAMIGMGRFPIGAEAFYRDDFGEYRSGPPVHGHQGNDIWAAFDAPIRAPANGIVRFEDSGLGGKGAFVTEPDGTYYYLAHLNGFAPGLSSGDSVRTGQLIGFNGDSGNARGGPPHVHFEIHPRGGAAVNPKPILDQWLNDALAGIPALVAPYLQGGSSGNRPITAVGIVRHFDGGGGLLTGPSRSEPRAGRVASEAARSQRDADSVLSPLTPEVLRQHAPPGL